MPRIHVFPRRVVGRWYLRIPDADHDQTIVSGWTDLQPGKEARAHFVRDDFTWNHRVMVRMEVEHETLGVVAGIYSQTDYALSFDTLQEAGRYRLPLTYVHEDHPDWQPNTQYAIGDVVRPATPNGAAYLLKSINGISSGASSSVEPSWGTSLAGFFLD